MKDNRLLPHGFLPREARLEIARALGGGAELADEAGATGVGDDPDYRSGGSDTLVYRVDLSTLSPGLAAVRATLYYQATPPFYLQDRFCTAAGADARRLYYLTGNLALRGSPAEDWKLRTASTGPVPVPAQ